MITRDYAVIRFLFLAALAACSPAVGAADSPAPAEKSKVQSVAATDSPAPGTPEYRLAPGDVVKISVRNDPIVEGRLSQDGKISLPRVGDVTLGGLTRMGAEKAISERLDGRGIAPEGDVNLLIIQYRSQ